MNTSSHAFLSHKAHFFPSSKHISKVFEIFATNLLKLKDALKPIRGAFPTLLKQIIEMQTNDLGNDSPDSLLPESRAILLATLTEHIDIKGVRHAIADNPEIRSSLASWFDLFLEDEFDKMLAFASVTCAPSSLVADPPHVPGDSTSSGASNPHPVR